LKTFRRFKNLLVFDEKAVVLIRNPLKVLLTYYRHQIFGIHSDTKGASQAKYWPMPEKTTFEENDLYKQSFEMFSIVAIKEWARSITDWIQSKKCLVVHFETFLENREEELRKILHFLEIPIDAKRLECASNLVFDKYKRKTLQLEKSPFTEKALNTIEKEVINVNRLLKNYDHQQIEFSRNKYQ